MMSPRIKSRQTVWETSLSVLFLFIVLHSSSGYSVKKHVAEKDGPHDQITRDSYVLPSQSDDKFVKDVITEEQSTGEDVTGNEPYTTVGTIVNDEENEISRHERDAGAVTERVPNEASANSDPAVEDVTTFRTPSESNIYEDNDNAPFVRPVTPDPNADPNYPTVNPIPDDFDINDLKDVNATGELIRGRAQCQCGVPVNRIVGGEVARIREYPWTVGLTRGGGRPYCGGTLINSRYVVTASHCVDGQSANRMTVVLGEQDFNSNSDGAKPQTIRVERITMHQNYNNKNIDNDIALLRLAQAVPIGSGTYTPICLPSSNTNDFAGESATVAGWGATSQGGGTSSTLRRVTVPVIGNKECNAKSKYNGKITQNMMCAGLLTTGGRDSCQGDSGGPLIIENGGRKTLIGIVSWGYGCAQAYSPGVYTRVARYPEWILANTRGADWCQG